MYDPPSGLVDMRADAEHAPSSDWVLDLEVPEVGVVRARRPTPNAIPVLASASNADLEEAARGDSLTLFVSSHLDDGEMERVLSAMMDEALPADSMGRIARSLATWGTARPYVAVINLSLLTATIWRTIRLKIGQAGLEPMALPTMHRVLDWTENFVVESLANAVSEPGRMTPTQFMDKLYAPEKGVVKLNGDGYRPPPPGFSPEETVASFAAFEKSMSAP